MAPFSNLDTMWLPFYTPVISIYRSPGPDIADHLRESLRRALALSYPPAGRVVTTEQPPGILCNDAGAPFVEAIIEANLAELQYENFQPLFLLTGMAEAGLGSYLLLHDDPAGRPALIVQMTRFKCGGVTLAVNWTHPVADGFSGFHFMLSWAELARGEVVSLLPVHDRALVEPREPLVLSNPFAGGHPAFADDEGRRVSQAEDQRERRRRIAEAKRPIMPNVQVVEITKQDVEDMKRRVESGASGESSVRLSRVCYLSAYLWRASMRARALPGTDFSRFWILVERGKKMSLPAGYFGNVVGARFATTTVSDLLEKPLACSASLVNATVQHCTKEWFQGLMD